MTSLVRPAALRHALTVLRYVPARLFLAAAGMFVALTAAAAAEKGIAIELNKTNTDSGACHASFVVRNGLRHTLDRFRLDLYVFGRDGVIKSRSTIDLAPLRNDKSTVFAFRIFAETCETVSRVLVNDIPMCRAENGATLDCVSGLSVSSRDRIELAK